jgi:hypothetical protein
MDHRVEEVVGGIAPLEAAMEILLGSSITLNHLQVLVL